MVTVTALIAGCSWLSVVIFCINIIVNKQNPTNLQLISRSFPIDFPLISSYPAGFIYLGSLIQQVIISALSVFWQICGAGSSLSAVSYCRGAVPFDLGWTVYSHSSIGYYVNMRELTVLCALKLGFKQHNVKNENGPEKQRQNSW